MAETSFYWRTGAQSHSDNEEDVEDGLDEVFFPGIDDELSFVELEDDRFVK